MPWVGVGTVPEDDETGRPRSYRDHMGKRQWGVVFGILAAAAALAGAGVLLYEHWDSVVSAVFSPIGGLLAKALFGGKVLKVLAVVGFAVAAGTVAVRKKLRGSRDEPPELAPPVYGPPDPPAPVR
jgi:hypothetical protein